MASREKSGRTGLSTRSSIGDVRRSRGGRTVKKGTSWGRWVVRVLVTLLVLAVIGAASLFGVIEYYSRDLPDVRSLRTLHEPQITRVLDRDGETLGEIFTERR